MENIIAFSGGKDSTALALRWAELGNSARLLYTPTDRELPEFFSHVEYAAKQTGFELICIKAKKSLDELIRQWNALPNPRQRWCTRMLKIQPCIDWLKMNPGHRLLVGLRADEEERKGLYSDQIETVFPLREWCWGIDEVLNFLDLHGVSIPERTDCDICFFQRLPEWYRLWREFPDRFNEGVAYEDLTGHTFRSPSRDTWPADLRSLGEEFARGHKPRGADKQGELFSGLSKCRVCSL